MNITSELQSQKLVQISFARVANAKGNILKSALKAQKRYLLYIFNLLLFLAFTVENP